MRPVQPVNRWTAKKKLAVLACLEECPPTERHKLMVAYYLSEEELSEWRRNFARRGLKGLMATH